MTITFLLVISLLLNGIAIFSIIVLFTRQNRLVEVGKTQQKVKKEMEELISTYLVEMKAENKAFIERFQRLNQAPPLASSIQASQPVSPAKDHQVQTVPRQKAEALAGNDWSQKAGKAFTQQAVKAYKGVATAKKDTVSPNVQKQKPEIPANEPDVTPLTGNQNIAPEDVTRNIVVNQIALLQKQGLSIEEIAEKLNKGKTEIELLLKFNEIPKH